MLVPPVFLPIGIMPDASHSDVNHFLNLKSCSDHNFIFIFPVPVETGSSVKHLVLVRFSWRFNQAVFQKMRGCGSS